MLEALKDRAREEHLAAGDAAGAVTVTKFQALNSLKDDPRLLETDVSGTNSEEDCSGVKPV